MHRRSIEDSAQEDINSLEKIQYLRKLLKFKAIEPPSINKSFLNSQNIKNNKTKNKFQYKIENSSSENFISEISLLHGESKVSNKSVAKATSSAENNQELSSVERSKKIQTTETLKVVAKPASSLNKLNNELNKNRKNQKAESEVTSSSPPVANEKISQAFLTSNAAQTPEISQISSGQKQKGNVQRNNFDFQDYDIKRFILDIENNLKNNVTIKKSWGRWSDWSDCSRSCGGGVKMQVRECTEKV